jgi:hypothetical protein
MLGCLATLGGLTWITAEGSGQSSSPAELDALRLSMADAQVLLGDRLFFETRFAQYYFERCKGDVNRRLRPGDQLVKELVVSGGKSLPGPFRGESINCRQCHLGDDLVGDQPTAGRTYCDFSRRSPIPRREDGLVTTVRNSPQMVGLGLPRDVPVLLHSDGEFVSPEDLTIATLTGRNFGWLHQEQRIAIAHIARVIRNDQGVNPRHVHYSDGEGVPYRIAMLGVDGSVPSHLRIPAAYRIDVTAASDDAIIDAVAKLIHAYMDSLRFGTHNTLRDSESPYDLFLEKNALPAAPRNGASGLAYAAELLALIEERERFLWVEDPRDRSFRLHAQRYVFGATELRGLKVFFSRPRAGTDSHVGNCVACHTPPQFTDHRFHNNGASQLEYDAVFDDGAFAALQIPGLAERNARFEEYLPASPEHPRAFGRFRSAPSADRVGFADLGLWNVFANPDLPRPQPALTKLLCERRESPSRSCSPEAILPLTIACFKTPSVRDLGQSNPYLHSGRLGTIEEVLGFYLDSCNLTRAGKLRNPSPEIADIRMGVDDIPPLAAFLRSLNEDYR